MLSSMLSSAALAADTNQVTINKPRQGSTYMFELMKLALSYSSQPYEFVANAETLSRRAQTEAVRNGDLDVMWGGTSTQMEQDFIPVRIDGYRGMMSLRFMLIRKGDQQLFDQVDDYNDLKRLTFGQGRTWADRDILESAGLDVVTAPKKASLFFMLDGERFDAFPRGATEAWREAEQYSHLDITVENGLIISYPLPTYFFVNKKNLTLARDIESGLEKMLVDGRFDEFFYNNDRIRQFLTQADLNNRRVIQLDNPLLPKNTPLHRKELWLSIEDLKRGMRQYGGYSG
ncbi:transporter substrate-binding domain-containing protein [Neiella sp. HB171785]|uniref:Transporter substrate-binding domain-containing protein n=2 Tax=Neiella litorisoli TaxID=2771431 RepID=A0A8J6ULI0_9GAMM|nr:transporter substrate-binding domain-containing protein [Neiella litorisoli]